MPILGALRIKNEARWIERVIRSIQPVCDQILILDDNSTDGTPEICEALGATVLRSPFQGLDESRDKDWLLQRVIERVPEQDRHFLKGNPESPYWCLSIDGDEVLVEGDGVILREAVMGPDHVFSLRILYLWDREDQWRVDGVYGTFRRPSLFRLMNDAFTYLRTPWGNGANFHCSSIPQELLHHARRCDARLFHLGYLYREDRLRKFAWYNTVDPDNAGEDCYRHMIQGDVSDIPATERLKWAGPLELRPL